MLGIWIKCIVHCASKCLSTWQTNWVTWEEGNSTEALPFFNWPVSKTMTLCLFCFCMFTFLLLLLKNKFISCNIFWSWFPSLISSRILPIFPNFQLYTFFLSLSKENKKANTKTRIDQNKQNIKQRAQRTHTKS